MNCVSCGKLYVIATPIGNLDDISKRAIETLKKVDLLLSEDTRETDKLLKRFELKKSQISYTDQKHETTKDTILEKLKSGLNLALLSDSGTPLISDPGFKLVRFLRKQGVEIVSIPGANAAVSALSISGLPTDKFIFLGFLPKSSAKRSGMLKDYGQHEASLVIYESPKRIIKLLKEIKGVLGDRVVTLAKDLTKKYERVVTDKISVLLNSDIKEKGEYTVLVAKEGYKLDE